MDLNEIRGGDMEGRERSRPGGLSKILFCSLLKRKESCARRVRGRGEEEEEKRKRRRGRGG